jgi:hypothetical protein
MRKLLVLIIVVGGILTKINAQYIPNNTITATQYGNTLELAFCGGMSAPQFSEGDFNLDGINDLFIFDRGSWVNMVFTKDIAGNYTYAPKLSKWMPALEDWALVRDYNCDGFPDIFTYYLGTTRVYNGYEDDGKLFFELGKSQLEYSDATGTTALYTSRTDIPAFDDIDFDGDLDVLSFSVSNATIRFYENQSADEGYGCDSLIFELNEFCWGSLFEGFSCYGGTLHVSCKGGPESFSEEGDRAHIGSTIVTYDQDGDLRMDAILGDNTCNNLVYYHNGGTTESAEMDYKDTLWQSNGVEFNMPTFPAGYFLDQDNDGDQDLIISTNDHLLGLNTQHVWLYENFNTNDTFDLVYQTDTFLVADMIDIGGFSKPIFFNYNNDGLLDILAGVSSTYGKSTEFRYGLWLYKNVGTASAPAFELVTKNFGGLDGVGLSNLAPAAVDIDNDGDEDVFVGDLDGHITFLENLSGGVGESAMAAPIYIYHGIDIGQNATPCFIDIQEDGKFDLIVGEANGNLNYFHNTGTATDPIFTLESEIWGGVDVRAELEPTGYSAPFMYRNENDSLYLVSGSLSGNIFQYNEIEDALLGEFYEQQTDLYQYHPGKYSSINGADIDNDGMMEFLTGSFRGGFQIFEFDFKTGIQDYAPGNLSIYPNPANAFIYISIDNPDALNNVLSIYSATGALIQQQKITDLLQKIDLATLTASGIYFIAIPTANGILSGSFVKL